MSEAKHQNHRMGFSDSFAEARSGLLRASLLFGAIAAALALIVVPAADRQAKIAIAERQVDVDPVMTGSVKADPLRYVVRRSVLQDLDQGPCLLFLDGTQRGVC